MPKKQNSKLKKNNKRQDNLTEKTEQILFSMPSIIVKQINKDHTLLKTQETKLKNDLKKGNLEKKRLMAQLTILKKKNSPSSKKQLQKTEKKLKQNVQLSNTLMKS